MKKLPLKIIVLVIAVSVLTGTGTLAQGVKVEKKVKVENIEKVNVRVEVQAVGQALVAADPNVSVSLSNISGRIKVHGWERNEVRAQTDDEKRLSLQRTDGGSDKSAPTRLQLLFAQRPDEAEPVEECGNESDITLEVPRGATVYVMTQSGDVEVENVAEARIESANGSVTARHVARAIEVNNASGDVALEDSTGRVRLISITGDVEATNVRPVEPTDALIAKSTSGEVVLDRVGQARVEASSITGDVHLTGPLARGGNYDFKTTSGDVTLTLPDDSSFKVTAQIFQGGEVDTNFPVKYMGSTITPAPKSSPLKRQTFTYGTGDASITFITINGTLRLRKK